MPPPGGVMVEFRLVGESEALWTAAMNCVPQKDDVLHWTNTLGATTTYEVTSVEFSFRSPVPVGENPPAQCQHTPVVYVTAQ